MSEPVVTISGQRVYPRGQEPKPTPPATEADTRAATARPVTLTAMSPSGWASGGNEETFAAGLPFLGALIAIIAVTIAVLLIVRRGRQPSA